MSWQIHITAWRSKPKNDKTKKNKKKVRFDLDDQDRFKKSSKKKRRKRTQTAPIISKDLRPSLSTAQIPGMVMMTLTWKHLERKKKKLTQAFEGDFCFFKKKEEKIGSKVIKVRRTTLVMMVIVNGLSIFAFLKNLNRYWFQVWLTQWIKSRLIRKKKKEKKKETHEVP